MLPSAVFVCLCVVAVHSSGEKINKVKRDVSGLFPFPRVGRADAPWNPKVEDFQEKIQELWNDRMNEKSERKGLNPFPRIGRHGRYENSEKKRGATENGGGMWFGPRLGRLQKRNDLEQDTWALVQIKDFPRPGEKKSEFVPGFNEDSSEESE